MNCVICGETASLLGGRCGECRNDRCTNCGELVVGKLDAWDVIYGCGAEFRDGQMIVGCIRERKMPNA